LPDDRRASDAPIPARHSSQVWNGTALFLAGVYCAWKIVRIFIIKAPWKALQLKDFLMAGNALQQMGQGVWWVWKRFTEPVSRPIETPPAVASLVARFAK